jgi:hypothetical protein
MKGTYATVKCCGKRRGLFPGGVLVCSVCDFSHEHASRMPNERYAKDIPENKHYWPVGAFYA